MRVKLLMVTIFFVLLLASCGKISRVLTSWTGELTYKCSKAGVEYIQSDSGLALSVDSSGYPLSCIP